MRFRQGNPDVRVSLMITWSRADHVYPEAGHWHGKPVYEMAEGLAPGTVDLWGRDHYHASEAGYYLEALVVFGHLTGIAPTALGPQEQAARELAIPEAVAAALQRVARDELAAGARVPPACVGPGSPRQ
jgi:hypothetical protein